MNVLSRSFLLILLMSASCSSFAKMKNLNLECDRMRGSSRIMKANIMIDTSRIFAYMKYNGNQNRIINMTYRILRLTPNPDYALSPATPETGSDYAIMSYDERNKTYAARIFNASTLDGADVFLRCHESDEKWPNIPMN